MPQAHFSEENPHFFLKPNPGIRPKKIKVLDPEKKPKFFTKRSGMRKGQLTQMAERVKKITSSRTKIYHDDRLFFRIKFSDSISGWKTVHSALESLGGEITKSYDDSTVKLAVKARKYEEFAESLEKHRSLIIEVRESLVSDKLEKKFFKELEESHKPQRVTIEVSDLAGLSNVDELSHALNRYAIAKNEKIELGYTSNDFAVFSASLSPHSIKEVADQVEIIESVERLPEIALISYNDPIDDNVNLASVVSLSKDPQRKDFPTICALDSGINRAHAILQGNVVDTYDFTTNSPKPCLDNDGHGSMVSGIVIYGGNHKTHTNVMAKILMVKAFDDAKPVGDIIKIIEKSISFFGKNTKVFNFSFSAFGPNRSLTKILDDLVFKKDLIIVTCTGNIDFNQIHHHLANNNNYPDYIAKFPIYFPGDSHNVITVGSCTEVSSNFVPKASPSPFTRFGMDLENIKPDVLAEGGNLNMVGGQNGQPIKFNHKNVGVRSASYDDAMTLSEGVGTSFSAPVIATLAGDIISNYNFVTPTLVKALILSSSLVLNDSRGRLFSTNIQGFGVPDVDSAVRSTRWRACYLLQGMFDGSDTNAIHKYKFFFPSNADRVTITFVVSKPPNSNGYFRFKVVKGGSKTSSNLKPTFRIGAYPIKTTGQAVYEVKRGGKGEWYFNVIPFFEKTFGKNKAMKYGCVITVESSKNLSVYNQIGDWVRTAYASIDVKQAKEAVKRARLTEDSKQVSIEKNA